MGLLTRVSRMDRREVAFRTAAAGRELVQRVSVCLRKPQWDWSRADAILQRPFEVDSRPWRFPLQPNDVETLPILVRQRFPAAADAASHAADGVLDGRLSILGYPDVNVGTAVDWHRDPVHRRSAPRVFWSAVPFLDPAIGDHKVTWEINRHQHWLTLGRAAWLSGERAYARAIVSQLDSWLDQNPPLTGINWASMLEVALRSLSWLWAMPFLLSGAGEDRSWLPRMLVALDAQLEHVRHNLSHYYSPNTHLLGEALALYVAGQALPELKRSTTWSTSGRDILLEQIGRQVHPDGGHVELSAHYHRYALDFYLLALSVARLSEDVETAARFEEVSLRLARYARALADDRGHFPLIGDDDGGQLFPICRREPADASPSLAWAAALLGDPSLAVDPSSPPEETYWLVGGDPAFAEWASSSRPEPVQLHVFRDTGYAVARTRRGDHVILDGGHHGFLNGGHAHDDALSCVLTLGGRPLLIDPGTSTYTMDLALRDRMRASTVHNTLSLDGRAHSEPAGPFHWRTCVEASLIASRTQEHGVWLAARHDAGTPLIHRRDMFLSDDGLVVFVDRLTGDTSVHLIEIRWTLDRSWDCFPARAGARLIHSSGIEARMVSSVDLDAVCGGEDAGWCAPVYGQLLPTWTLISRLRGQTPAQVCTVFSDGSVPPTLRIETSQDGLKILIQRPGRQDILRFVNDGVVHERRVTEVAGAHTMAHEIRPLTPSWSLRD